MLKFPLYLRALSADRNGGMDGIFNSQACYSYNADMSADPKEARMRGFNDVRKLG